ncbi:hypothetical protein CEXT_101401 [Caerostris extrusa]|uniref:Uncharacterized protein n=1 Tax=Caerostris extrusa TaxID=172846 RepID=A0AAV4M3X6_CAEEX|nr:hypothetical protein CEXT_101401 [Caerostris extrusa]
MRIPIVLEVLARDENCSDQRLHGCFPDRGDAASFPGTEEELRQLCSYLRNGVRCLEDVKEDCGLESHDQERMEIVGDFTRAICQEGSRLYTNIVENLACLKERIENDFGLCRTITINNLMSLHEHLEDKSKKAQTDFVNFTLVCMSLSKETAFSFKLSRNVELMPRMLLLRFWIGQEFI